jgi:ketosteroid isomerase-like protein
MRKIALAAPLAMIVVAALPASAVQAETGSGLSLEQRVDQLESEKQIREAIIRYGEYLDARDYKGYASLFASGGTWTGGFGSATGPAAIQAMLEKNMGMPEPGFINKDNFHLDTTVVVDVHGDTATARSRYMFFTRTDDDQPKPVLAGRYFDEFVRENGDWKIRKRTSFGVIPYRDGNAPPPAQPPAGISGVLKKKG